MTTLTVDSEARNKREEVESRNVKWAPGGAAHDRASSAWAHLATSLQHTHPSAAQVPSSRRTSIDTGVTTLATEEKDWLTGAPARRGSLSGSEPVDLLAAYRSLERRVHSLSTRTTLKNSQGIRLPPMLPLPVLPHRKTGASLSSSSSAPSDYRDEPEPHGWSFTSAPIFNDHSVCLLVNEFLRQAEVGGYGCLYDWMLSETKPRDRTLHMHAEASAGDRTELKRYFRTTAAWRASCDDAYAIGNAVHRLESDSKPADAKHGDYLMHECMKRFAQRLVKDWFTQAAPHVASVFQVSTSHHASLDESTRQAAMPLFHQIAFMARNERHYATVARLVPEGARPSTSAGKVSVSASADELARTQGKRWRNRGNNSRSSVAQDRSVAPSTHVHAWQPALPREQPKRDAQRDRRGRDRTPRAPSQARAPSSAPAAAASTAHSRGE